jgi:hypothetical protein
MYKIIKKAFCFWLLLFIAFSGSMLSPQLLTAQSRTKKVSIKKPSDRIKIANYRVMGVVDDRVNPSIGYMTTYSANKFLATSLENPLPDEVSEFINSNVDYAGAGQEVTVHIKRFFISEEMPAGAMAKIRFRLQLALFNKNKERLLDASYVGEKFTGPTRGAFIGQLMGDGLEDVLKQLDKGLPKVLARYNDDTPLKQWIELNNVPEDRNLFPYSEKKPLNLANFTGKAPSNAENIAGTECGFLLDYQIIDSDGALKAIIEVTPYFKQSSAWIKPGVDVRQAGAYAQNHFDICAIITCDLVNAIDKKKFTFASIKAELDALRKEYEQKLKAEINKQIAETGGGNKVNPLEDWIEKIEFEMRTVDCYQTRW